MRISLWIAELEGERARDQAASIKKAIAAQDSNVNVEIIDVLSFWSLPLGSRLARDAYQILFDEVAGLRKLFSDKKDEKDFSSSRKVHEPSLDMKKIRAYLEENEIDLVVALHPYALLPAADIKRKLLGQPKEKELAYPLLAILPAFHLHETYWQPSVSRYLLSHQILVE